MNKIFSLLMSASVVIFSYCNKPQTVVLQSGDLLFSGPDTVSNAGELSKAIDEVTCKGLKTNFSHVGIVEVNKHGVWVIHAEPKSGVVRELLNSFVHDNSQGDVFAYRFKPVYQYFVADAVKRAHGFVGQPYDFTYSLNDSAQYCSGLIYKLFEAYDVFELRPMTFLDPATGGFHPFWIDYFDKLGIEIPEGYPGCNPNGMASSDALDFLGIIKK